ncbi:hypothetical protein CTZ27_29925 [Streptomyces griseocarneus]|nr:hypothetical protein CTZ27_29925 [Streptomyces griseocarneus]
MTNRLASVYANSDAVLLYPGSDIDGAEIAPGEIAVAVQSRYNSIALHGPREQLLDRLLQLAEAVRNAPPVPTHDACIADEMDIWGWDTDQPVTGPVPPAAPALALCGETRPVATDPRLATCPQCIETWNDLALRTPLSTSYPVPALP